MIFKEPIGFIKDKRTQELYVYLPFDVLHNPLLLDDYITQLRQRGMPEWDSPIK